MKMTKQQQPQQLTYFLKQTKQEQIKKGGFSNFNKHLIVNYKNKQS